MAESDKHSTLAQVMILWSMSSSPASGSVLTAGSLEPVSDSVSPSLSDPPPFMLCLKVSLSFTRQLESKGMEAITVTTCEQS